MFHRLPLMAGSILIAAMLTVSCAGESGSERIPTSPELAPQVQIDDSEPGRYLWAYYEIAVDPENDTYELTPFRSVADHWNVLKFLERGPCTNCVKILNVTNTGNGTKIFDVQITHPQGALPLPGDLPRD